MLHLLAAVLRKCKYICLVNLLAGEELYPECIKFHSDAAEVSGHVIHWLDNPLAKADCVAKLTALRNRVAIPGAVQRAAEFVADATIVHRAAA